MLKIFLKDCLKTEENLLKMLAGLENPDSGSIRMATGTTIEDVIAGWNEEQMFAIY